MAQNHRCLSSSPSVAAAGSASLLPHRTPCISLLNNKPFTLTFRWLTSPPCQKKLSYIQKEIINTLHSCSLAYGLCTYCSQVNSPLHYSGVAKSSTGISFGWDKGSYTLFDMISANPNHNNSNVTPKSLLGHAHLCCSGPLRVVTVDFSIN